MPGEQDDKQSDDRTYQLGDAPIEAAYVDRMKEIALILDEYFNEGSRGSERDLGFVLLVFPFGDKHGRCNYISNGADRHDIAKLFREQANRFEEG